MGRIARDWARAHCPRRGSYRALLLEMAELASDEQLCCWASVQTLSHKTKLGRRQVQRLLRELEADKMIVCERRGKGRETSRYRIPATGQTTVESAQKRQEPTVPADRSAVTGLSPRGVIRDAPAATPAAPKPAAEPKLETESEPVAPKQRRFNTAEGLLDHYAADPRYRDNPHYLVQRLLADHGCDDAYCNRCSARSVSPRLVADSIIEMHRSRTPVIEPARFLRSIIDRKMGWRK